MISFTCVWRVSKHVGGKLFAHVSAATPALIWSAITGFVLGLNTIIRVLPLRGGQIYDNWMATLEADAPKQTHPAYPAAGYGVRWPLNGGISNILSIAARVEN